jgi:hypothetical protein
MRTTSSEIWAEAADVIAANMAHAKRLFFMFAPRLFFAPRCVEAVSVRWTRN